MKVNTIQVVKIMMVRDKTIPYYGHKITEPKDVAQIGFELFNGTDREHLAVIALSRDNTINAVNIVSQGSVGSAPFHPREVLKPAILANASAICLLHNHTSLSVLPSSDDIAVTRRIIEAANLLQIKVFDHVIVAEDKFYSLKEHDGLMFKKSIGD